MHRCRSPPSSLCPLFQEPAAAIINVDYVCVSQFFQNAVDMLWMHLQVLDDLVEVHLSVEEEKIDDVGSCASMFSA